MITLIVDVKLMMYLNFHRNKSLNTFTFDVASLYKNNVSVFPSPDKIVFAFDVGKSHRVKMYKEYKAHRKTLLKKKPKSYQNSVEEFEKKYLKFTEILKHFGNVIDLPGIEADDVASIIAKVQSVETENTIIMMTSDSDWIKFMTSDNIHMLHVGREKLISRHNLKEEFNTTPEKKILEDSICGVGKENIKGLKRFGTKTFNKYWEENDNDYKKTLEAICSDFNEKPERIPEGFSTVEEMYDFNLKLIRPIDLNFLTPKEKEEFSNKINSTPSKDVEKILYESYSLIGSVIQPTALEMDFYKLSYQI